MDLQSDELPGLFLNQFHATARLTDECGYCPLQPSVNEEYCQWVSYTFTFDIFDNPLPPILSTSFLHSFHRNSLRNKTTSGLPNWYQNGRNRATKEYVKKNPCYNKDSQDGFVLRSMETWRLVSLTHYLPLKVLNSRFRRRNYI